MLTNVTGIFYHPSFSRRSYLTQGSRLRHFPRVIEPLLRDPRFRLFESPMVPEDLLLRVHSAQLIREVDRDPLCSTGRRSAGGVVLAGETVARGEIRNAFAFIGAGGHHSGRTFFGGSCCFNDVVLAVQHLRDLDLLHRFAILDTDAHHGDGTRQLVEADPDVLHVCVCHDTYESRDGTKVDVPAPSPYDRFSNREVSSDVDFLYADAALSAFEPRVRRFRPDLIFWYFGFDTHRGDYGDLGLSGTCYTIIADRMKELAEELCSGRLEVVLGGGSRSDIARDVIPPILGILGGVSIPPSSAFSSS
ncbi:MAG TPA: hypothetical protein PLM79_14345 [Syntrophobacteraceae bacterium]|nr:hypothetical protein [Syntrophobacteraceae bacterium]